MKKIIGLLVICIGIFSLCFAGPPAMPPSTGDVTGPASPTPGSLTKWGPSGKALVDALNDGNDTEINRLATAIKALSTAPMNGTVGAATPLAGTFTTATATGLGTFGSLFAGGTGGNCTISATGVLWCKGAATAASFNATRTTSPMATDYFEGTATGNNKTTITTQTDLAADATITFGEQSLDFASGTYTDGKYCTYTASGTVFSCNATPGDVTGVGDCASGACLDGTSDGGTNIALYDGNSNKVTIDVADIDADATLLLGKTYTDGKWCAYSTTVGLTCNEDAPAGSGDVTGVGDCSAGACYDGTSDGGTYVRLYDGTSAYEMITGGVRTFTFASSTANAENLIVTLGANDNTVSLTSSTGGILQLTTPVIGAATGTSLALGATPSTAGVLKLENGAAIGWKDGTEATITHVNDTGLKFNLPITLSNDESISNVDDTEITFVGTEAISLDLDTGTANQVAWKNRTTSSTGVTDMSFSALNLVTTGTIQGGIKISSDADGMDAAAMTAVGMYGTMFIATGAGTWILPTAVAGMSACLMSSGAAAELILDTTAGDTMRIKGTEGGDGKGVTNAAAEAAGDFVCVIAVAANKWSTVGLGGAWLIQP